MAQGGCAWSLDEDPWKISALTSAFLELCLSILLLFGAAIAWITAQFVKYSGLDPPCSFIGCTHVHQSKSLYHRKFYADRIHGISKSLCPDCLPSHSCLNIGFGEYTSTKDSVGDIPLASSHISPRTLQYVRRGESGVRDYCAAKGTSLSEKLCRRHYARRKSTTAFEDVSHHSAGEAIDGVGCNILEESTGKPSKSNSVCFTDKHEGTSEIEGGAEISSATLQALGDYGMQTLCLLPPKRGAENMDPSLFAPQGLKENVDENQEFLKQLTGGRGCDRVVEIADTLSSPTFNRFKVQGRGIWEETEREMSAKDHSKILMEEIATGNVGAKPTNEDPQDEVQKGGHYLLFQDNHHVKQKLDGSFVNNDPCKTDYKEVVRETGRYLDVHHSQQEKILEEAERWQFIHDVVGNSQYRWGNEGWGKTSPEDFFGAFQQEEEHEGDGWELSIEDLPHASEQQESICTVTRHGIVESSLKKSPKKKGVNLLDFLEEGEQGEFIEEAVVEACVYDGLQEPQLEGSGTDTLLDSIEDTQNQLKVMKEEIAKTFLQYDEQKDVDFETDGQVSVEDLAASAQIYVGDLDVYTEKQELCIRTVTGKVGGQDLLGKDEEYNEKSEFKTVSPVLKSREQQDDERINMERGRSLSGFHNRNGQEDTTINVGMTICMEVFQDEYLQQESIQNHQGRSQQEEGYTHFQEIESEDGVDALTRALQVEQNALSALYQELEEERNAAASAANEAMAMISRLQEEKAAMQMKAAQYHRMAEEKAMYDQQAMSALKEILLKQEEENFALEKELELYQERLLTEQVEVINKARVNRPNGALCMNHRECELIKENEDNNSSLKSFQDEQCAETDSHDPEHYMKFVSVGKNFHSLGSTPLEKKAEDPDKGLNSFPLDKDDRPQRTGSRMKSQLLWRSGLGKSIPRDTLDKINSTQQKAGEADGFKMIFQSLLPGDNLIENRGKTVVTTDDEETFFILERLWVLEEQLKELRERGCEVLKSYSNVQAFESRDPSSEKIASCSMNSLNGEQCDTFSNKSNGAVVNYFLQTPRIRTGKDSSEPKFQGIGFSKSPGNVADSTPEIDGPWNEERKQRRPLLRLGNEVLLEGDRLPASGVLPVEDVHEVQNRLKNSEGCSLSLEENKCFIDSRDRLGRPDFSPENSSQEGLLSKCFNRKQVERKGTVARKLFSSHSTPCSGPFGKVNVTDQTSEDSPYPIGEQSLSDEWNELHTDLIVPRSEVHNLAEEKIQQFSMRLQILEADSKEHSKQSLQSLERMDTGIFLLQEIAQHLRELQLVNRKTLDKKERLQVEPLSTSYVEACTPAMKKRRCWSGSGQAQILSPDRATL